MTFGEFQNGVLNTWTRGIMSDRDRLLNAVLGIVGEGGEYADMIKKQEFHGVPADRDKVFKELGDVLYYVTAAAFEHGFTLEHVAETNNKKLAARYPNGFKLGGGIREEENGIQPTGVRFSQTTGSA